MTGEHIYRNFSEARGGEPLAAAAEMVKQLVGEYEQQADEIIDLTGVMESAWQGDAAGAAQTASMLSCCNGCGRSLGNGRGCSARTRPG
jgi:hypothetical protein